MGDVDILVAEDNPGDINLIERAFADRDLPGSLHIVTTGAHALDWLHRRGQFAETPRPELVLLDLNLPETDGLAVLEEIKSDPRMRRIPVIVFTGTRSRAEVTEAYNYYANAFLTKPVDPEEFMGLIEHFAEFWAGSVALPEA